MIKGASVNDSTVEPTSVPTPYGEYEMAEGGGHPVSTSELQVNVNSN